MASQQGLRKALGSIKDSTKIGLAKVNSTYKVGVARAWIFSGGTGRAMVSALALVSLGLKQGFGFGLIRNRSERLGGRRLWCPRPFASGHDVLLRGDRWQASESSDCEMLHGLHSGERAESVVVSIWERSEVVCCRVLRSRVDHR